MSTCHGQITTNFDYLNIIVCWNNLDKSEKYRYGKNKLWYKMMKTTIGSVFNTSAVLNEVILWNPPIEIINDMNKVKHYLKVNMIAKQVINIYTSWLT